MVKPADLGYCDDVSQFQRLDGPLLRCVLPESEVRVTSLILCFATGGNHFPTGNADGEFNQMDSFVFLRLTR